MYLDKKNWLTTGVGMFCNFLGGWFRYAACRAAHGGDARQGKLLALLSSVFIGFAAAVIICSYSAVATRWFPPHERTLATTIAVQSNYAGWCVGAAAAAAMARTAALVKFYVNIWPNSTTNQHTRSKSSSHVGRGSRALSPDPPRELHVLDHDRDALRVDCAQIGVHEQPDEVRLRMAGGCSTWSR